MSGGSFNYLYQWAEGWKDMACGLGDRPSDLDRMAAEIRALQQKHPGVATKAAEDVALLEWLLHQCQVVGQRLAPVFKAVEWWRSSDWGEDSVVAALAKHAGLADVDTPDLMYQDDVYVVRSYPTGDLGTTGWKVPRRGSVAIASDPDVWHDVQKDDLVQVTNGVICINGVSYP